MSRSRHPCRLPAPPAGQPRRLGGRLLVLMAATAVAGVSAACERDAAGSEPGLSAGEFATVIVELREAERAALETDSVAEVFARRKAEILERHGTTEEEIRGYVETASRDVEGLAELWEEISNRLRRPAAADSL